MYNGGKIIFGLLIFVALVTSPFWANIGRGNIAPELKLDTPAIKEAQSALGKKEVCVEPRSFMLGGHMQLLNQWRDSVIRNGKRTYTNSEGRTFDISLQNTCLKCHSNKKNFCDKCHNYLAVSPYCFDCHLVPKEDQAPAVAAVGQPQAGTAGSEVAPAAAPQSQEVSK
jgi:hypothetical protein